MRVKVRAVIRERGGVVVAAERRQGREILTLPGGRIRDREDAERALVREVREETGVDVAVGPLIYVAEVVGAYDVHELNLIFDATVHHGEPVERVCVVELHGPQADSVFPPILATIAADAASAWPPATRWLGNVYTTPRA
jgi:8-oxo-dGTP pyrophosphatase MutT (NUDIX family)